MAANERTTVATLCRGLNDALLRLDSEKIRALIEQVGAINGQLASQHTSHTR